MYYTFDIIRKFCNIPKLLQYPLALYSHPKDSTQYSLSLPSALSSISLH